ncbi:AraC family transcriptional regulator [Puteibacter caeruleilacunae]|nr:AraC family transcriptional regulator [Puteibacter caeruleilacunae]
MLSFVLRCKCSQVYICFYYPFLGYNDTFSDLCDVKHFKDIHSYYPENLLMDKSLFADFAILKLEDLATNLHLDEYIKRFGEPHLRDFFEVCIEEKDSFSSFLNVGNDSFVSGERHIAFASPVNVFSINHEKRPKDSVVKGYILAFKPSFLLSKKLGFEIINTYRFFNSYSFPQHKLSESTLRMLMDIGNSMYKEYTSKEPYSREIIGGYMEVLLNTLNRILKYEKDLVASSPCEYIAANFERKIIDDGNKIKTVADYADRLNISSSYLTECVKKVTGKSAKQVVTTHKLIVAKSLLQQKGKSIAEIAYEMEFSEPTNFTKFFKQKSGQTPNQFRSSC